MDERERLADVLRRMIAAEASDLHIAPTQRVQMRCDGVLMPEEFVPTPVLMEQLMNRVMSEEQRAVLSERDVDFSWMYEGRRFRGNAYRMQDGVGIALRLLPARIPTPEEIGMPAGLRGLAAARDGLALICGATGAGKTTTLAKVAAHFVLEQNLKGALITADTYRISAVEQLKKYAEILGLPVEVVYSAADLRKAIARHRSKDFILVDTAGRSQYNEFQMDELKELLAAHPRMEKHLVVSATTKEEDVAEIMKRFSVCKPDRIIFTKTDETRTIGMVLNLLAGGDLPLSFLSNGQSVPDDIIPATADRLAELLLRR